MNVNPIISIIRKEGQGMKERFRIDIVIVCFLEIF